MSIQPNVRFQLAADCPKPVATIFQACVKSLADRQRLLTEGVKLNTPPGLPLVMPGHRPPQQNKRYLVGHGSPLGEIVSDTEDGQIVTFQTLDVLAWIVANKWATTEEIPQGDMKHE